MCPQLVFLLQHTQEGAAKRKKNRVDGQRLVQYDRGQRRKWGRLKLESLGGLQKTVKKYCLSSWKGFSHPLVQVYCRTASHPVSSWHLIICQSRLAAGGVLVPNALQVESGRAASEVPVAFPAPIIATDRATWLSCHLIKTFLPSEYQLVKLSHGPELQPTLGCWSSTTLEANGLAQSQGYIWPKAFSALSAPALQHSNLLLCTRQKWNEEEGRESRWALHLNFLSSGSLFCCHNLITFNQIWVVL